MKVLSIKEPYASLIAYGYKKIETRSWKTNYRGKILIHASKTDSFLQKIDNPEILNMIKNIELNYGKIICKADLIDCIYMSPELIDKIKQNHNEYILGKYEENRYAWILDNIEIIEPKIEINGKLNLWNYPFDEQKKKLID